MPSPHQLHTLAAWLQRHRGHVHADIDLTYSDFAGVHCRARTALPSGECIFTVPHSLALSSLNALVDDFFPVFRNRGLPPQAIGYFYLMHQYIQGQDSFWKPYLDTIPGPEHEHRTPFWFEEDDLAWLEDTDVLFTFKARLETHQDHFDKGIEMLENSRIDTAPYTWNLYKWAVTIFTSRSFSSRALHLVNTKYWAAYKQDKEGARQTVLLDMSNVSAEDLDFPVLFPVLDIPNHSHDAKVDWNFAAGQFAMAIGESVSAGSELFNNYGPKSNDELLLGYGFCLPLNPHDKVLMTLKPPPPCLQADICTVQPGYFTTSGDWSSEKATFGLKRIQSHTAHPANVFEELPAPLLELLAYMIRHERRLPFEFMDHPRQALIDESSPTRQYLPHITRMIVTSMAPKLQKLQLSAPATAPRNERQLQAQIYRTSQIEILQSVMASLRGFLLSLLRTSFPHPQPLPPGPFITTLDGLLQLLGRHSVSFARDFVDGIVANAGSADLPQLRAAGWEEDMFVLLLCYCQLAFGFDLPEYCTEGKAKVEEPLLVEEMEQARGLMELVSKARQAVGMRISADGTSFQTTSLWNSPYWSEKFIATVGGRLLVHESFMMIVPFLDGVEETRPVVYIHGSMARAEDVAVPQVEAGAVIVPRSIS